MAFLVGVHFADARTGWAVGDEGQFLPRATALLEAMERIRY
jgi:hypothetical protein